MIEYQRHTVIATVNSRMSVQRSVISSQANRPVYLEFILFNSIYIAELPAICLADFWVVFTRAVCTVHRPPSAILGLPFPELTHPLTLKLCVSFN